MPSSLGFFDASVFPAFGDIGAASVRYPRSPECAAAASRWYRPHFQAILHKCIIPHPEWPPSDGRHIRQKVPQPRVIWFSMCSLLCPPGGAACVRMFRGSAHRDPGSGRMPMCPVVGAVIAQRRALAAHCACSCHIYTLHPNIVSQCEFLYFWLKHGMRAQILSGIFFPVVWQVFFLRLWCISDGLCCRLLLCVFFFFEML